MTSHSRRTVKYKRVYTITVEGSSQTTLPEDSPFGLMSFDHFLRHIIQMADMWMKNRKVSIWAEDEEILRADSKQ